MDQMEDWKNSRRKPWKGTLIIIEASENDQTKKVLNGLVQKLFEDQVQSAIELEFI